MVLTCAQPCEGLWVKIVQEEFENFTGPFAMLGGEEVYVSTVSTLHDVVGRKYAL